jgi:hypothetical protein
VFRPNHPVILRVHYRCLSGKGRTFAEIRTTEEAGVIPVRQGNDISFTMESRPRQYNLIGVVQHASEDEPDRLRVYDPWCRHIPGPLEGDLDVPWRFGAAGREYTLLYVKSESDPVEGPEITKSAPERDARLRKLQQDDWSARHGSKRPAPEE